MRFPIPEPLVAVISALRFGAIEIWGDQLRLSLGIWRAKFKAENITLDNMAELTNDDLKELGLPMGARKDVLKLFSGTKDLNPTCDVL